MAKPRRKRCYAITHARARARLQKGTQGIMSDYTMASSTSWRCPNCMAIVPSGQSHACTTAYPPFEPAAHAQAIQAEADRLRVELAQARAERDAHSIANVELAQKWSAEFERADTYRRRAQGLYRSNRALRIEVHNQLTALKMSQCAELVAELSRRYNEQVTAAEAEAGRLAELLRRACKYVDHNSPTHDCAPMYGCACGLADLLTEIDAALTAPAQPAAGQRGDGGEGETK